MPRRDVMAVASLTVLIVVAGSTVANAGGPAGGIGFSRSWGTSFVPPVVSRSPSTSAGSLWIAPSVPPTAWFQTYPPVQRVLVPRPSRERIPLLKYPAPFYDVTGGCE